MLFYIFEKLWFEDDFLTPLKNIQKIQKMVDKRTFVLL